MDNTKKLDELAVSLSEIRIFAEDAYDYIWKKTKFKNPGTKKAFEQDYAIRNPIDIGWDVYDNFLFRVGSAVRISQFLLRDYFRNLLPFAIVCKNIYKKEIKVMWSHWLEKRSNIFVKVIDTLAIIAEAFFFCDSCLKPVLKLKEVKEWFVEWFEEKLASDFIERGGWKVFHQVVIERYEGLESLELIIDTIDYFNYYQFKDVKNIYDCSLVSLLRNSRVKFPIPEYALCEKCRYPGDKKHFQRIVYVRLKEEFLEINFADFKDNALEREIVKKYLNDEQLKKYIESEKKIEENIQVKEKKYLQNHDDCQSFSTEVSNDYENYLSRTSFSNSDNDNVAKQGLKFCIKAINSDNDVSDIELEKCIIDSKFSEKTEDTFLGELPSKGQGLSRQGSGVIAITKPESNKNINLKTDSSNKNIQFEKQVNQSDEYTKMSVTESSSTFNIISSSESIDLQPMCVHETFLSNQTSHNQEKSMKVEDTSNASAPTVAVSECILSKHNLPVKDSSPGKQISDSTVCQNKPNIDSAMINLRNLSSSTNLNNSSSIRHSTETPNYAEQINITNSPMLVKNRKILDLGTFEMFNRNISFSKILNYESFRYNLFENVINPNYKKIIDQSHFHFVSEKYSDSLKEMFESDFINEEKPGDDINNPEKLMTKFQNNGSDTTYVKTEDEEFEQTLSGDNWNYLEILTIEYRYYYFKEKTSASLLKHNKNRKSKSKKKR